MRARLRARREPAFAQTPRLPVFLAGTPFAKRGHVTPTGLVVALVSGFLLAFLGSMPPTGPIAVLVLERGVTQRHREARAIALGAALPEGIYAALGVFGASAVMARFPAIESAARLLGIAVLLVLGVLFARFSSSPQMAAPGSDQEARGACRAFFTGFWISTANPTLILTWSTTAAMLYSLGGVRFGTLDKLVFALAVATGTTAWFWVMSAVLQRHSDRVTVQIARRIIRTAGIAMVGLAVLFAVSFVRTTIVF